MGVALLQTIRFGLRTCNLTGSILLIYYYKKIRDIQYIKVNH